MAAACRNASFAHTIIHGSLDMSSSTMPSVAGGTRLGEQVGGRGSKGRTPNEGSACAVRCQQQPAGRRGSAGSARQHDRGGPAQPHPPRTQSVALRIV